MLIKRLSSCRAEPPGRQRDDCVAAPVADLPVESAALVWLALCVGTLHLAETSDRRPVSQSLLTRRVEHHDRDLASEVTTSTSACTLGASSFVPLIAVTDARALSGSKACL